MRKKLNIEQMKIKANSIRRDVVEVCVKNGAGHIAPSLSCVDILIQLYYQEMKVQDVPTSDDRDRLIFSKSHGCYGLYAILCDIGFIPRSEWSNFYNGSSLSGCSERNIEMGLEASCGSLGHGLPLAVGTAFAAKLQKKDYYTFCLIGDGEMQEGSIWEAIQFSTKHKLDNLIMIIDRNGLQAMDFLDNILTAKGNKKDLNKKLDAFGFCVEERDGHDIEALSDGMKHLKSKCMKNASPGVLIANTVKGYGLKCMENLPKFHFRIPTEKEVKEGNRYE